MERLKKIFGYEDQRTMVKFNDENTETKNIINEPRSVDKFTKTLLKYIPLHEDDCLSCKLISTAVVFGTSVFVLGTAIRHGPKQTTHIKKVLFYVQCTALSTFLGSIGVARFFDLSIFQKEEDKEFHLYKSLQRDADKISNYFENLGKK